MDQYEMEGENDKRSGSVSGSWKKQQCVVITSLRSMTDA